MKFAAGKRKVTPHGPVFMAGYGARDHASEGVMDDLYVKAVVMRGNKTLLILAFDFLGGDSSFVRGVKRMLKERFGFSEEEVMINFSHTHASIYATGEEPEGRRGYYSIAQGNHSFAKNERDLDYTEDIQYYRYVLKQVCSLVEECLGQLKDGTLHWGKAKSDFAVSRRRPDQKGGVVWAPYNEAEIDDELTVMKLIDCDRRLCAVVFGYGCHPTAMGPENYQISAEFVGHACACLESEFQGAVAVFLQGCAAELKPRLGVADGKFKSCSPEQMRRIGEAFADEVVKVMRESAFRFIDGEFSAALHKIHLYTQPIDAEFYERQLNRADIGEFNRGILTRLVRAIREGFAFETLPYTIQCWELDSRTRLIALESEVSTEYAVAIKKLLPGFDCLVLGYSNGVFTYIPTAKILKEGGYEAEHYQFYGLRGPFVPEVEDILIGRIVRTLGPCYGGKTRDDQVSK